jgi:hypothetical protein
MCFTRGLLPFSGVILITFETKSMSLNLRLLASPDLIPVARARSDYAAHIRGLLKEKFPDKVNEVKIMLTELLPESSPETRKFIMSELDQL